MDTLISNHKQKLMVVLGAGLLIWLYIRLAPTLPTIMQDELVYAVQSRHTLPEEARFPNYFFSWVYSSTNICGPEFYSCVKGINFVFLAGLGVVLYLIGKKVVSPWLSFIFAAATIAGPISLYGSVFMPEAMYVFFAILSFYLLLITPATPLKDNWKLLLLAAVALALTTLVKPHALFLAAGFALYILIASPWRVQSWKNRLVAAVAYVSTMVATKLLLGFVFAGTAGLTLFGGYGSLLGIFQRFAGLIFGLESSSTDSSASESDTESEPQRVLVNSFTDNPGFIEIFFQQFLLHLVAMGLLLAPALFIFVSTRFLVKGDVAELALLSLAVMIPVISLFGAYVTVSGDDHTDRVLLRYYEFLIPLVLLGSFQVLAKKKPEGLLKFAFFGFFLVTTVIIAGNGFPFVKKILSDSSYLLGMFEILDARWAYSIAVMVSLLFILASPVQLTKYLVWTMGIATVFSGYASQQAQININSQKIGSDFAGIYVRDELANVPGEEIFVIGSDKQLVEASIFWMDRPGVTFDLYNAGSLIPEDLIPDERKVIVQILGVSLEDLGSEPVLGEDYVISFVD